MKTCLRAYADSDSPDRPAHPRSLIKTFTVCLQIDWTFHRKGSLYLACNRSNIFFFTSKKHRNYTLWACQKVCEALTFLLDNIYIRFGSTLFRQILGIPMGTNCAPLVADLFLMSLSEESNLKLLKLSARRLDIWTIYQILTIITSIVWSVKFILPSFN